MIEATQQGSNLAEHNDLKLVVAGQAVFTSRAQEMEAAIRKAQGRPAGASRWEWRFFRLSVAYDMFVAVASVPIAIRLLGLDGNQALRLGSSNTLFAVLLFVLLSAIAFSSFGIRAAFWRHTSASDLLAVVKAVTCAVLGFALMLALAAAPADPARAGAEAARLLLIALPLQWLVLVGLLCGARLAYAGVTAARRRQRRAVRYADWEPVIVVGADEVAALLIQLLGRLGGSRFQVVGLVDERPYLVGRTIHGVPVLGTVADLPRAVARLAVHGVVPRRVVLGMPTELHHGLTLERLREAAGAARLPVLGAGEFMQLAIAEAAGQPPADASPARAEPERPSASAAVKRAVDIVGASLLLVALAPFLALVALAIRVTLGAPVIFRQVRLGKDCRPFILYKFRTLKDALSSDGRILQDKERRSPVGNFLRRTRLDELPQLWNVLTGDMSLIGPRPLLAHELPDVGRRPHPRFSLRPGITGWAQVNGGRELSTLQKFALDLWYMRHFSLWLDFVILCRTVGVVILGRDAHASHPRTGSGVFLPEPPPREKAAPGGAAV